MIFAQLFENGTRIFSRLEFRGALFEVVLIFAQVGPADFEKLVEREVDHFIVLELFPESVGANAVVAVRAWEQVSLEPTEIIVERGDDGSVSGGEFSF